MFHTKYICLSTRIDFHFWFVERQKLVPPTTDQRLPDIKIAPEGVSLNPISFINGHILQLTSLSLIIRDGTPLTQIDIDLTPDQKDKHLAIEI